jgi:hypothetical protein
VGEQEAADLGVDRLKELLQDMGVIFRPW